MRYPVDCIAENVLVFEDPRRLAVTPNPLIVLFKHEIPSFLAYQATRSGLDCRDAGFAYVCSSQGDDPRRSFEVFEGRGDVHAGAGSTSPRLDDAPQPEVSVRP